MLSERLKNLLPFTIAEYRSKFVANRKNLEASPIANEIIDDELRRKESGVVIKLDIRKAFGQVY